MKELAYYADVVDGEVVFGYQARDSFTVDGIWYDPRRATVGLYSVRPMIGLIDPDEETGDHTAEMFCSDPPTDAELNLYTHLGILPPT